MSIHDNNKKKLQQPNTTAKTQQKHYFKLEKKDLKNQKTKIMDN